MSSHGPGDPRPSSPARPSVGRSSPARSGSVLVVGEDPALRDLLARALRRRGADVATAAAGREALRMVADGRVRPSVLLTDIEMPGMSGIELAARATALRPGIRIVMMTGDPDRAAEARRHGDLVHAVLLKPVSLPELVEAIAGPSGAGEPDDPPPDVEASSRS